MYATNGIIEPISIRPSLTARSNPDRPIEATAVKGEVEGGAVDVDGKVSSIVSISEIEISDNHVHRPYIDDVDYAHPGLSVDDNYDSLSSQILPFKDNRGIPGIIIDPESEHLRAALENMRPETETFIKRDSISMKCGFMYETYDAILGTDSISFGGFTYDPLGKRYNIHDPIIVLGKGGGPT